MHYKDALRTPGPSAVGPLASNVGPDVYYAAFNGELILRYGEFEGSSFPSEQLAIAFAEAWAKQLGRVAATPDVTIGGVPANDWVKRFEAAGRQVRKLLGQK